MSYTLKPEINSPLYLYYWENEHRTCTDLYLLEALHFVNRKSLQLLFHQLFLGHILSEGAVKNIRWSPCLFLLTRWQHISPTVTSNPSTSSWRCGRLSISSSNWKTTRLLRRSLVGCWNWVPGLTWHSRHVLTMTSQLELGNWHWGEGCVQLKISKKMDGEGVQVGYSWKSTSGLVTVENRQTFVSVNLCYDMKMEEHIRG